MSRSADESRLAEILAEVYDAEPEDGRRALEEAIAAHPELASELRDHAEMLDLVSEAFGAPAEAQEPAAEEIGGYRLLDVLGRGGMATVYRAAQEEPVQREVAVKVLHQRLHGPHALARFEVERESLARMNHPHIARVLDAGFTKSSMPYVAMELVEGEPITDYCERKELPIEARLGLFTDVCEAVQHAHQKGVIHRDLKPTNVLVSDVHGEAHVKVIDFGLAKALDDSFAGDATLTVAGQILGTPAYMSPEQATGDDVDATTDVYGLGMLLYELLVGEVAWDRDSITHENFAQFIRRLAEEEPPRPSARLSTLHGEGVPSLPGWERRLRGELDWITMKALAKERERRYPTPRAVAEDIGRFLRNEPVVAGPPSRAYRLRKFVDRHRTGVVAATVAGLALIAGSVISTVFASEARTAQERELDARVKAEATRDKAEELTGYVLTQVQERLNDIGRLDIMEGVAKRVLAYYEEAYEPDDMDVATQRAEALFQIGNVLWQRGDRETAVSSYRLADGLAKRILAQRPSERQPRFLRAIVATNLASAAAQMGDEAAARSHLEAARGWIRALVAERVTPEVAAQAAGVELSIAYMERGAGDWEAAEARLHGALVDLDRVQGEDQGTLTARVDLVSRLASWKAERGKPDEAKSLVAETIERVDAYHRAGNATVGSQTALMELLSTGAQLVRPHDLELAERAVELGRSLVDSHPQVAKCRRELSNALRILAATLFHWHRPEEAAEHALAAVDSARILTGLDNGWSTRYDLAVMSSDASKVLAILRRHEEALRHGRTAIEIHKELAGERPSPSHAKNMARANLTLAETLRALEQPEEAERAALDALKLLGNAEKAGASPDSILRFQVLLALGHAVQGRGDVDAAIKHVQGALAVAPDPVVHPWFGLVADAHHLLSDIRLRGGAFDASLEHARQFLRFRKEQVAAERGAPQGLISAPAWRVRSLELLSGVRPFESPMDHCFVAYLLHTARRFDKSVVHWRSALEDDTIRGDLGRGHLYNAACSAARASEGATGAQAKRLRDLALEWLAADRALRRARMTQVRDRRPQPPNIDKLEASYARTLEHARVKDADLAAIRDLPAFKRIFGEDSKMEGAKTEAGGSK